MPENPIHRGECRLCIGSTGTYTGYHPKYGWRITSASGLLGLGNTVVASSSAPNGWSFSPGSVNDRGTICCPANYVDPYYSSNSQAVMTLDVDYGDVGDYSPWGRIFFTVEAIVTTVIIGCTDRTAENYNPAATQSDNSLCIYRRNLTPYGAASGFGSGAFRLTLTGGDDGSGGDGDGDGDGDGGDGGDDGGDGGGHSCCNWTLLGCNE